jgi:hypothetical protein
MSDQTLSPESHADWLNDILVRHRDTVGVSPAYIVVCTSSSPLSWGQLVRIAGDGNQIEEGDHVIPCGEGLMPHGITTTDIHADQTVTILVGLWSEDGPIRG